MRQFLVDLSNGKRCNCCPSKKDRRVSSTREGTQASWVGAAFDVDVPRRLSPELVDDLVEAFAALILGFALGIFLTSRRGKE